MRGQISWLFRGVLILLLFAHCSKKEECAQYWMSNKDSSKFNRVFRSVKKNSDYITAVDSMDVGFKIVVCKNRRSSAAEIKITSMTQTEVQTQLLTSRRALLNADTFTLFYYLLDDEFAYDDELIFIWCEPLGLIAWGARYTDEVYKFRTCSDSLNRLVDTLVGMYNRKNIELELR